MVRSKVSGLCAQGEDVSGESGASPLQRLLGLQREKPDAGLSAPAGVSVRCSLGANSVNLKGTRLSTMFLA